MVLNCLGVQRPLYKSDLRYVLSLQKKATYTKHFIYNFRGFEDPLQPIQLGTNVLVYLPLWTDKLHFRNINLPKFH